MPSLFALTQYTLDKKNRFFVPPMIRDVLKKERANYLIIAAGLEKCLMLFLPSQWEAVSANARGIIGSKNKEDERAFKRFFFGNACQTFIDGMGRILITQTHKNYAGLSKKIIVAGVGDKAEIWDYSRWQNYCIKKIEPRKKLFAKIYDI
ncbi:MAG: division/cell wall cluster transcriptional repressor MraZ [Elusimicrobia bacterium]|nr:division/cell wall cluster transcriptional repressor MraZ [Elusimicrobiota bacterium]